jgi:hypothetical protein
MCSIIEDGDGMECASQRYICRVFYFTSLRLSREVFDEVYDRWTYY